MLCRTQQQYRILAILLSNFLLDLHRANKAASTYSGPSAIGSLNFQVPSRAGDLPAFIAPMGASIHTYFDSVSLVETEKTEPGEELERAMEGTAGTHGEGTGTNWRAVADEMAGVSPASGSGSLSDAIH